MYGGDEVSAIVIDLGSHTCKAGYAGEDAPKAVFPSVSSELSTISGGRHLSCVTALVEPHDGENNRFTMPICYFGGKHEILPKGTVVGSIDQMEVDDGDNLEKHSGSAPDSEKGKSKRKLYVGSQSLGFRRDNMEVLSPFKDGIVADWDIVDSIWDQAFRECLLIDPKEHPMLLAEPSSNTQQQRERAAELMFEKYKVPALFLAKNAVLTSFASGRATSLVVDCGGGSTTVAPVHDGYVLQKAVLSSPIGGEFLTDCLTKSLESKGITIKPRYSFKRKEIRPGEFQKHDIGESFPTVDLDFPNTTESYRLYCQRVISSDIKECVCRAPDTPYDEAAYSNIPMTAYELPDGQYEDCHPRDLGVHFPVASSVFYLFDMRTIPGMESYAETAASARGLPQMLAGGTASMQQLKERLEKDLLEESPQAARVKVLASGNATERRFSVWIGGSILASLGSFQQMWFSKSEYDGTKSTGLLTSRGNAPKKFSSFPFEERMLAFIVSNEWNTEGEKCFLFFPLRGLDQQLLAFAFIGKPKSFCVEALINHPSSLTFNRFLQGKQNHLLYSIFLRLSISKSPDASSKHQRTCKETDKASTDSVTGCVEA
ncbi:hypothetical protein Cgig2_028500 [Carnegiea gigantea]|uniref:Actin-related protein 4 n=1 Tax=Carnegiea gigantea TaxID=171969 RepID=A0A9Q1JVK3_9CARY|nr:hypothetical protein Cgig2_028500 [Carnegiea gigantea]